VVQATNSAVGELSAFPTLAKRILSHAAVEIPSDEGIGRYFRAIVVDPAGNDIACNEASSSSAL
jgi:hypothetical protein